tara:strand:+ start:491 stop:1033 length:543 start_codon:yes stop_codon:yes gene_type:complete
MSAIKGVNNLPFLTRLKNRNIYQDLFQKHNLETRPYKRPQDYVDDLWNIYETYASSRNLNNNVPGSALEVIVGFLLDREGIQIERMDELVPNVRFAKPDFLIRSNGIHVVLSLKTSLRERWKQADWEAIRIKKNYPQTKNYLIVNSKQDAKSMKSKIPHLDLEDCFYIRSNKFDVLIQSL